MFSAGIRTSVRKSSPNSARPFACRRSAGRLHARRPHVHDEVGDAAMLLQNSWITAVSAFSAIRRGSRKPGSSCLCAVSKSEVRPFQHVCATRDHGSRCAGWFGLRCARRDRRRTASLSPAPSAAARQSRPFRRASITSRVRSHISATVTSALASSTMTMHHPWGREGMPRPRRPGSAGAGNACARTGQAARAQRCWHRGTGFAGCQPRQPCLRIASPPVSTMVCAADEVAI